MNAERDLTLLAQSIRLEVLEEIVKAGKGHIGPAFSWVEIGVALYFAPVLNISEVGFDSPERDRFVLSKGHGCQTLYAILRRLGVLEPSSSPNSKPLPGHPDVDIQGVEANSGSLGHGLGIGLGIALAAQAQGRGYHTFVLLGDGELGEGSVWEALMLAGHRQVRNLTAIIDRNGLGATSSTEDMLQLEPLGDKLRAFGWNVARIDGHDIRSIVSALQRDEMCKPKVIIADTIKAKGVPFMENDVAWHHKVPTEVQADRARASLQEAG